MELIRGQAKILIVEDEAIVAEDLRESLEDMGYTVSGVSATYEDAVKKAEELQPDLVLMDIMLKGDKTGIDAVREIRKKKDIPVIYVTAFSSVDLVKKAEKTRPIAYLVKPIDQDELATCIKLTLVRRMREMKLEEKIKELEKERDPKKRLEIEKEVAAATEQVEIQRKECMIFFRS